MIKINLIVIAALIAFIPHVQGQSNPNEIVLSSFDIELNGNNLVIDTTISAVLVPDVTTNVILYEEDFVLYGAEFTYKYKGKRAKLVRRTYALLPDGKKVYSKKKKDMQELKVSVPGVFKGKSAESILYAKKTMGYIFVSFNYEYSYK